MCHFMLEHLWKDRERSAHWAQRKYEGKMTWVENTPSWVLHPQYWVLGWWMRELVGKQQKTWGMIEAKGCPFNKLPANHRCYWKIHPLGAVSTEVNLCVPVSQMCISLWPTHCLRADHFLMCVFIGPLECESHSLWHRQWRFFPCSE